VTKIVGILLVKQCVLLDPSDATPVRRVPLNSVATVAWNEPLLGVLDRFQEGRSHMAVVTRFSREKAASVKKVVKKGLTQRIKDRVGMGDSSDSSDSSDDEADGNGEKEDTRSARRRKKKEKRAAGSPDEDATLRQRSSFRGSDDVEASGTLQPNAPAEPTKSRTSFQFLGAGREQSMPADAVLPKANAQEFLQSFDGTVAPLGLITLEDVLEGIYMAMHSSIEQPLTSTQSSSAKKSTTSSTRRTRKSCRRSSLPGRRPPRRAARSSRSSSATAPRRT
jgi:metal transporter CNNM